MDNFYKHVKQIGIICVYFSATALMLKVLYEIWQPGVW